MFSLRGSWGGESPVCGEAAIGPGEVGAENLGEDMEYPVVDFLGEAVIALGDAITCELARL